MMKEIKALSISVLEMDAKWRTARHEIRRHSISKNAAQDAIQILSFIGGDRPPSFRQFFSSYSSSSSSAIDNIHQISEDQASGSGLPPKPSLAGRHALKGDAALKSASGEVKEFLVKTQDTDYFRCSFPHFRSSSSISCASSSSFHTCTEDEHVLYTNDDDIDDERSLIFLESNTLVEMDSTNRSDNIKNEITEVAREQGGIEGRPSEANQPLARTRRWLEGWWKGTQKSSKLSSAAQAGHAVKTDLSMEVSKLSLAEPKEKTDNFWVKYVVGEFDTSFIYYPNENKHIRHVL